MGLAYIASYQRELSALRELSARIGNNPLLVQASAGNSSVKIGNALWIKASGKWFIDAEVDDFLVPVDLMKARQCFSRNVAIRETEVPLHNGRRASTETAMHAVLLHKVVVHVHSVNAIAWAVREDGPQQLCARLAGLDWQWIPYTPSGMPLAREISDVVCPFPQTNVFVLANHGLVVCGDDCDSVEELLGDLEARLAIDPRRAVEPQASLLLDRAGADWSLPTCTMVHALATDPLSRRILSGGMLYPCQAIFLPDIMSLFTTSISTGSCERDQPPAFLLIEGHGVVCSKNITQAEEQVLRGLANVVQRIDQHAPVRYLTHSEVLDLWKGPSYQNGAADIAPKRNSRELP